MIKEATMAIFARIPFAIFTMLALSSVTHHVMGEPGIYYVQDDHLGTPQALYDQNSQVIWRSDYAPFGQANVDEDPDRDGRRVSFPIRFPGQYLDGETGLHYNYFRDYDPSLGRYVQSDPIGLQGGLNTYGYVRQNPLIRTDPFGLFEGCRTIRGAPGFADTFICDDGGPDFGTGDASFFSPITDNANCNCPKPNFQSSNAGDLTCAAVGVGAAISSGIDPAVGVAVEATCALTVGEVINQIDNYRQCILECTEKQQCE
jgi:RHS repeat-associated protein